MAEDSDTLTVRMLRVSGKNKETQWFEYRPSFRVDIVRIEWELDTMVVELDTAIADYLLRAGYAAPLPQGSAPPSVPAEPISQAAPQAAPVSPPWKPTIEEPGTETAETPPPAPSWLKSAGGS
jgi:hypothetical protein